MIADLKARNARVIYSLNFPSRSRALPPDADEPVRELRARAQASKTPAALEQGRHPVRVLVGGHPAAARLRAQRRTRGEGRAVAGRRGPRADDQRGQDRRRRRAGSARSRRARSPTSSSPTATSSRTAPASSTCSSTAARSRPSRQRQPAVAAAAAARTWTTTRDSGGTADSRQSSGSLSRESSLGRRVSRRSVHGRQSSVTEA